MANLYEATPLASLTDVAGSGTPGSGVAFFSSNLTMPAFVQSVDVTIACSLASVLTAVINGASVTLNSGTALGANQLFAFQFPIKSTQTLNFSIASAAAVTVFEVRGLTI